MRYELKTVLMLVRYNYIKISLSWF